MSFAKWPSRAPPVTVPHGPQRLLQVVERAAWLRVQLLQAEGELKRLLPPLDPPQPKAAP